MTLLEYYHEISEAYSEHITQQQMYEICGFSKSTAYKAENSGAIPFVKEVNHLLHTHRIKLIDALAFKYKREHGYRQDDEYISYLRRFYDKRLKGLPDILTVSDISEITGFVEQSVQRWIGKGYLKAFAKGRGRGYRIPKESLIVFLVSPAYNSIQNKSDKQIATLQNFRAWYSARIGGVKI